MDLNMNSTHEFKIEKKERKKNRKERKTWPCPELCNNKIDPSSADKLLAEG